MDTTDLTTLDTPPAGRRRFGIYPCNDLGLGIWTAEAAYKDGYESGLRFPGGRPGGPHITAPRGNEGRDPDWHAYCVATVENHREWLRGYDDAQKAIAR